MRRLALVAAALALLSPALVTADPGRDLLVIALDAVPFAAAAAARTPRADGEAPFGSFHPPVPLVSSFPSTTSVALGEILEPFGLVRSPGYEARFFDWDRRRRVGGGAISYYRIDFGWRQFFHWNRKGPVRSAFAALRPIKASIRELATALDLFVASDEPSFAIYIAPTDIVAHLHGPERTEEVLVALDRLLDETRRRRAGRPFDTVIFSDHGIAGGEPLANVHRDLRAALRQAGLHPRKRLRRTGDVVLTPFGLVSSFEIYAEERDEARVVAAATSVTGIDLCARARDEGWQVTSASGHAEIRRQQRDGELWWSYDVSGEDPLGLRLTGGGTWVSDRELFRATSEGVYPDALHRLTHAFELVDNPASVVCSLAPGHMYGSRTTELLARLGQGRLRWTHGALYREATLGFLMTDAADWRPNSPVRASRALLSFVSAWREGRAAPAGEEPAASGP